MLEQWITLYSKNINSEAITSFLKKCKKTSEKLYSETNTADYSINRAVDWIMNKQGAYLGIHFDEKEGTTFGINKNRKGYEISFSYLMLTKKGLKKMLSLIELAYSSFHPYFGASANDEVGIKPAYKNGKLPKYFEWFWILGPEIAKKYDLTKIPRKFKVKKMKDGGIMITDPKPYDSNITEQDKKQLYNLPKAPASKHRRV